jgi:hypothetical protein
VVGGGTWAAALASGVSVASGLAFNKYEALMTNFHSVEAALRTSTATGAVLPDILAPELPTSV